MRHSLTYLIGIIVGTTVALVAAATGITAALLALPAIGSVLLGISAAYILWLAHHIATSPPLSEQTAATDDLSRAGGAPPGVAKRAGRPSVSSQPGRIAILVESSDRTGQSPISPGSDSMNVTRQPRTTFAPRRGG